MVNAARNSLLKLNTLPASDTLKTASKIAIQKIVKATGNLTGDKISNKFIKTISQNNSKTI